jgi:hypothetical protein
MLKLHQGSAAEWSWIGGDGLFLSRAASPSATTIACPLPWCCRLKLEEFEPYFEGKKKVLPRPSDLSFYNWDTQTSTSNSSPNFQVIADNEAGLLFKNKRDRKVRCAAMGGVLVEVTQSDCIFYSGTPALSSVVSSLSAMPSSRLSVF